MIYSMFKKRCFRSIVLLFAVVFLSSASAQDVFIEKESIAIVEIESAPINSGWKTGNTSVGGKAITYYTAKTDYFNTPNMYTLTYKIQITNPGTYRFQWHCKVGEGSSATDFNDSWLKLPDATDFYAKKSDGHVVRPKGVCTSDCPNGAGSGGWFKVYSNGTVNWSWRANTSDNDPHLIYARFDAAGIYTILISARSKNQFLDRFVVYNPTKYSETQATDLSRAESEKLVVTGITNLDNSDLEVYPNPASTQLVISAKNNNLVSYEIIDFSGQLKVRGQLGNRIENLDISTFRTGLYILKYVDSDGFSKSIKFVRQP